MLTLHSSGAYFNGIDGEGERDPPPEATKVTFPPNIERKGRSWTEDEQPPDFQRLFSRILRPSDISDQHENALNIDVLPSCAISDLIPSTADGSSYLPSLEPRDASNVGTYAAAVKSDYGPARKYSAFQERLVELQADNDLAFHVINRTTVKGSKPPRLAHMRKFWQGLENMSQYWDCSLDNYYAVEESDDGTKSPKRQKLDSPRSEEQEAETIRMPK